MLKKKYGMTEADYDALLNQQNGQCGICRKTPDKRRLAVDHCHATNRVRGLLCDWCNRNLGWFERQKEEAEAYLKANTALTLL